MGREGLDALGDRIKQHKTLLEQWRQPSEPLLFETLRAIDHIFCHELFVSKGSLDRITISHYSTMTWGVNHALARMIPEALRRGPFRLFPSEKAIQGQADDFLLQCGILERAERLYGWIVEGLVSARLDTPSRTLPSGIRNILVLKSESPSIFKEVISRTNREWMSDLMREFDVEWETRLELRHVEILPELAKRVEVFNGWGISYSTTKEIDEYFLEWGQVYLRRMWSQDLVGPDDKIGGEEFRNYLGVLSAVAGRAQKHLCFASMLKQRHTNLDLRNLLTYFCNYEQFVTQLSHHLDADTRQIARLLSSLTLGPENKEIHTTTSDTAWAPIVRSSHENCILPLYGLEINPFLFLLRDLQGKYADDWFRAANNREKRWLVELKSIFHGDRWIAIDRNLKLRDGANTVTDIDFLVYDNRHNEVAIFQLKWQHPVGTDNRARRSAGKNLVSEANRWTEAAHSWLDKYGAEELMRRAGVPTRPGVFLRFFIIARYNAFFPGYADQDIRAVWADWNLLMKMRLENPEASLGQLAEMLKAQNDAIALSFPGESYVIPIVDLAIILNPTSEPVV